MRRIIAGWLIVLGGLIALIIRQTPKTIQHEPIPKVKKFTQVQDSVMLCNVTLDSVIIHLKTHEGFRSNVYSDGSGHPTIGYGHQLLKGERYNDISEAQATSILKQDFEKKLKYVQTTYNVRGDTAMALALFCFNCGEDNLEKIVNAGLFDEPSMLLSYCHYSRNGRMVKSEKLLARRQYEYNLIINKSKV